MRNKIILSKEMNTSTLKWKRFSSLFGMSVMLVLIAFFTWQCKDDDFTGEVAGVCPEVITTDPTNGAINVVTNKLVTATFNEAMDPSTIDETTFFLKKDTTLVSGVVSYNGVTATFVPTNLLDANTVYSATIKRDVKDPMGNIMIEDETWSFNTGSVPTVILTDPVEGASDVALDKIITADFSTAMNATTINASTFVVMQGSIAIPGTITYSGVKATFTPTDAFKANKVYSATITKNAKDVAGNAMAKDTTWSFATGTLPIITVTNPINGAVNVPLDKKITATFSKLMNATTITPVTFTLKQGTTPVLGLVSYEDMTATFTPTSNLLNGVEYTATITTGVKDLSNKTIPSDSTWKFTTGLLVVPVLPYVTLTDPANEAINVPLDKVIKATFSKIMDNSTINSSTFTLMNGTTPVLGFVTYSGHDGFFTPVTPLLMGTTYEATITTGAKDLDGNAMASAKKWSFTTIQPIVQYTAALSSNPTEGGSTSGGGLFNAGTSVTAIATPNLGYTFTNWTENGIIVSNLASFTFIVNSNRNLVANFSTDQLTVALSSNPVLGGSTTGGGLFNSGASVTVTATPNAGYSFSNWTEGGVIVSPLSSYTFVVSANRTLVANFTAIQYTATLSSNPVLGGSTSGGGLFNAGASVTAVATPNAGYTFANWTENGSIVSNLATYTFTINNNRTLVANFNANQLNVALSSNPVLGGSTSGGGLFNSGASVTVTATPNAGYSFSNWTEGGVIVSPLSSYTFVVSANRTLVANFTAIQYTVAVSSNPLAGGNTNGSGLYNAGASVSVTATANAGYSFNKWTEGGIQVSTSANYTFVVNNNRTLVANFAIVNAGPDGVNLRSAGDFAVIAGGGISNTGVTTRITGDVGSFPTATINGLLAGNVIGTLYTVADPIVGTAKTDLTTAYNDAQSRSLNAISLPGQLGGLTLAPGLYVNSSTSGISGTGANGILTLDAGGNPNAVWIFKMGSTLITDAGTSIVLAGNAQAKNIYWSVGTSATLGTNSIFYGNILADQSITLTTGATLTGRALTRTASVTLDTNIITKP